MSVNETVGIQIKGINQDAINSLNEVIALTSKYDKELKSLQKTMHAFKSFNNTLKDLSGLDTSKLDTQLDSVSNSLKKLGVNFETSGKKAESSVKKTLKFSKVFNLFRQGVEVVKSIGNAISRFMDDSFDFTETMNLYRQAMQTTEDQGKQFVTKMASMFGIATNELMKYQATFKNMIGTLGGISDQDAYNISELLTRYALDYASLYNVDFDAAMTKYQAALSKQVRPIRSTSGYDITQATLQESLKSLQIDRTVASLTEMEKRLVIIYSLQQQMIETNAMGDLARTIEAPANQLRVLKQQLQEVSTWLGNVFYNTLDKILPYVNGFVMGLREIIKALALFVGYNPQISGDPLADYADSAESANDAVGSAAKTLKKMKDYSLPFDELHAITPDTSTGGGGGAGISQDLLDAIGKFDNDMENIRMRALDIRNAMLDWLGFSYKEDQFGTLSELTLLDDSRLRKVLNTVKALGVVIAGFKFKQLLAPVITFFTTLTPEKIAAIIAKIKEFLGVASLSNFVGFSFIVAALINAYNKFEEFRLKVQETFANIGSVLSAFYYSIIVPLVTPIAEAFGSIWDKFTEATAFVATLIMDFFNTCAPHIIEFLEWISPFVRDFSEYLATTMTSLFDALTMFILDGILLFKDFCLSAQELLTGFGGFLSTVFQVDVEGVFDAIGKTIKLWALGAVVAIQSLVNGAVKMFNFLIDIINAFKVSIPDWEIFGNMAGKTFGFNFNHAHEVNWVADAASKLGIGAYADGGFPEFGELFLARESGNELVGRIGNKSAVMNNDQLITSVARGVRDAMLESGGGEQMLHNVIELDGEKMYESTETIRRRRGVNFSKGGLVR